MELRDIEEADFEEILQLNNEVVPAVSELDSDSLRRLVGRSHRFLVATSGVGVAGFLLGLPPGVAYDSDNYQWFSTRYDTFNYVDRVVVASDTRSIGVGRMLYDAFVRDAVERRVPVVLAEVNTRPRNERSLRFHDRYGFREVGTQDTEGGAKSVVMLEYRVG